GQPDLRREVEKMLAIEEKAGGFMERSAFSTAADLLASSADSVEESRFLPGDRIANRYRVAGLLGRGGMGEVYRADDLKLGQPVALKFLPRHLASDPGRLERFYAEVRIARLPPDKALEIARELCAGLAAAHDRGVLHRDLKPANIMIDGRGRARITDFGLAVVTEEGATEGVLAGTPAYMAPEQLAGKGASVRSDVYSLGLVLYELFTGKKAFEAGNLVELRRQKETTP